MYSAIKRTIGTAALMLSFIAGPASAFGIIQPITGNGAAVGTCGVSIAYNFFDGTAAVYLSADVDVASGGDIWFIESINQSFPEITEEQLVACGVSLEAGSLVQEGASGSGRDGFEAQALMGFGYRETGGQWREYKIGSGTLEPDETAPTVTLTSDAGYDPQVGPFSVLAVFSETIDPTTLAFDTFSVINGDMDISSFTVGFSRLNPDMTIASFDVTPSSSGVLTVTAPVGFFSDSAGNTNTESGLLEVNVSTAVGLTLTADAVHNFPAPIPVSLVSTNSLLTSSMATGDFTVTNGTINEISLPPTGGIVSSFDFNVLPTTPGAVTISVAEGVFETYSENF